MIRELFFFYSRTYFQPADRDFLINGLIFGDDSKLSAGMTKLFQGLGLSHFTAASGANLRLLVPQRLSEISVFRYSSLWLLWELAGVVLYLKMATFSASLWRASLFWVLGWLGKILGRRVPSLILFLYVLLLTLVFRAEYFGSLGFQLSFLCVVALYFSQMQNDHENTLQELIRPSYFVSIRYVFRESVYVFLFLSPLLFYRFQTLAPIGVVGTIFVSPLLQLLTELGVLRMFLRDVALLDICINILYSVVSWFFFCLWFVDSSVLRVSVWLTVLIGILQVGLQVWRKGRVWREIQ